VLGVAERPTRRASGRPYAVGVAVHDPAAADDDATGHHTAGDHAAE
jgi:hypothetical protein